MPKLAALCGYPGSKITVITAIDKKVIPECGMRVAVVNDHNKRVRFIDDRCPPVELGEIQD